MRDLDRTIDELIDQYSRRQISRRDFFRRAAQVRHRRHGRSVAAGGMRGIQLERFVQQRANIRRPGGRGTLREGYNRDVSPIDPVGTTWWDAGLFPVTHETLVTADADGNFIPLMADSWETSADGLTWTFPPAPRAQVPQRRSLRRQRRRPGAHNHLKAGGQRRLLGARQVDHRIRLDDRHHQPSAPLCRPAVRPEHRLLGNLQPRRAKEARVGVRHQGRGWQRSFHARGTDSGKPFDLQEVARLSRRGQERLLLQQGPSAPRRHPVRGPRRTG